MRRIWRMIGLGRSSDVHSVKLVLNSRHPVLVYVTRIANRIGNVDLVKAVPFSEFDLRTINLLNAAWSGALRELHALKSNAVSTDRIAETVLRVNINLRVAAAAGERDPEKLKQLAIEGIGDASN